MKIRLVDRGAARRLAVIAAIIAALPHFFYPRVLSPNHPLIFLVAVGAVLSAFALLVFLLRIEVNRWWGMIVEQFFIAGIATCVLYLPIFDHAYAGPRALAYTVIVFLILQMAVFAIFGGCRVFGGILLTVCLIYGIIEYQVFRYTENLISVGQILSVRTGMNVMGNYPFLLGPYIISAAILYLCAMVELFTIRNVGLGKLHVRCAALVCAVLTALVPISNRDHLKVKSFKARAIDSGVGIPLELLLELRENRVRPPEGYSPEALERLEEYVPEGDNAAQEAVQPHVIAVMLEAFSDLEVLGDFETSEDPLSYTRSLGNEAVHGYFLASTYAGGTSRTEWEFLTGNSMFLVPADSVPFRQYVSGPQNSLVRVFKNAGYHTIGMHCHDGNGWDRNKVYPLMGFDDIYFKEDLQWDGTARKFVSDSAFVHQVINLFEANDTGKPLFFFGVTMQNHGSYDDPDFEADVHAEGLSANCDDVDQYLSLVKRSDEAIRELIEYFRGVEEPVEIVFFGDHQPRMNDDFYREIGLKQTAQKYIVPYVIWKNYSRDAEERPLTSANYLTAMAARAAGVAMPAYYGFLETLSQKIPAVCGLGYVYDDVFFDRDKIADADAGALLNEYARYQYANLFDDSADPGLFQGKGRES